MDMHNNETGNPYILKRQGKFGIALQTYADKCLQAHDEGDEFIAQVCFDQMIDITLLEFLKGNRRFSKTGDLKREVNIHLKEAVRESKMLDGRFQDYFDSSWEKFGRVSNGQSLLSVRKEQLIGSDSDTVDYFPLSDSRG